MCNTVNYDVMTKRLCFQQYSTIETTIERRCGVVFLSDYYYFALGCSLPLVLYHFHWSRIWKCNKIHARDVLPASFTIKLNTSFDHVGDEKSVCLVTVLHLNTKQSTVYTCIQFRVYWLQMQVNEATHRYFHSCKIIVVNRCNYRLYSLNVYRTLICW